MSTWCKVFESPNSFNWKNWLDDPTTSFDNKIGLVDLDGFGEVEEDILDIIDFCFFMSFKVM
jgi:hypothetical protein